MVQKFKNIKVSNKGWYIFNIWIYASVINVSQIQMLHRQYLAEELTCTLTP